VQHKPRLRPRSHRANKSLRLTTHTLDPSQISACTSLRHTCHLCFKV
jgi:hypothetical protein